MIAQGKGNFVARARLMLVLGEQLITDEVAAVYELIKNSYDADATQVKIRLEQVTDPSKGRIEIKDNGSGMSLKTLLTGWLELATSQKARGPDEPPRLSPKRNRVYLGEKGIGRLAVHKLGNRTEIITRLEGSAQESRMVIDWTEFEDDQRFLESIPISWEERLPQVFVKGSEDGFESGTLIIVLNLRPWTRDKMVKLSRGIDAIISPLFGLKDFEPQLIINDREAPEESKKNVFDYLDSVPYKFEATIDATGKASYVYTFRRLDFPELNRTVSRTKDIRHPDDFPKNRKPVCGPVRFRLFSWELLRGEKKELFGDTAIYDEVVRPNTGVKVFRDGFRVLPYGDRDNDWLGMDKRRIAESFEERVSRSVVIGLVDISAKSNPHLIDKSDREGLIDNEAFTDFRALILSALAEFEADRLIDRRKLKDLQGRSLASRSRFVANMTKLNDILERERSSLKPEVRFEITRLVTESKAIFENSLSEAESPLLVAASIGLTYMIPTHEARRNIQESMKILRNLIQAQPDSEVAPQLKSSISLLRQAQEVVGGIADIMQVGTTTKEFQLKKPVDDAIALMKYKMGRTGVQYTIEDRKPEAAFGTEKQIVIALVNIIDNSVYWLGKKDFKERQLKIIIDEYHNRPTIVVSDNGPGIDDDIDVITMPFFTRKPNGMGLGLFICDRIAKQHKGELRLMNKGDVPGLLPGASLGILFPETK